MSSDLQRFIAAQDPVFATVIAELRAGRKSSHWMWFIFPQHRALGRGAMAVRYGLGSLSEARAYADHPVLGPRLTECVDAMLAAPAELSVHAILGSPDDLKFPLAMTIFALAAIEDSRFRAAIDRFCEGALDARTVELLQG